MNKPALSALATTLLTISTAYADPAAPTKLVCNQSGATVFEAQFDGPRYADSFSLEGFDGDLVKPLLATSERAYSFTRSSLRASISVGKCTATPTGDTILSCTVTSTLPLGSDWILASYTFQHSRALGGRPEFNENVSVERWVQADSARLTVTKRRAYDPLLRRDYVAAHVRITLTGLGPFGRFNLTTERTLGELVAEDKLTPWETCAFVK